MLGAMALSEFNLHHPLRVRWAEVDPQGIVFNPHYLAYLDVGITEYWRAIGLAYPQGFEAIGTDLVMAKSTAEYRGSARFDDELIIAVRCARIGRSSLRMLGCITRGSEVLTELEAIYVAVSGPPYKSMPIPDPLAARIEAYEQTPPERG